MVIAIISILAGLLLPALSRARAQARMATCQSNLRQVGVLTIMYADDQGDYLPPRYGPTAFTQYWFLYLSDFGGVGLELKKGAAATANIFLCPASPGHYADDSTQADGNMRASVNYAVNNYVTSNTTTGVTYETLRLSALTRPSSMLFSADGEVRYTRAARPLATATYTSTPITGDPSIYDYAPDYTVHPGRRFVALWCDGHVESPTDLQLEWRHFNPKLD